MIKKFIDRILGKHPGQKKLIHGHAIAPLVVHKKTHHINPQLLSKNAVKVTATLQQAGFDAYIVGGAVRDLLLGIAPKDFDVATNATPEEVQRLFRKSRLIGRRFQIVHVTFYGKERPEIIEVSTFRAHVQGEDGHIAASGRILRDNVWGSQAEDATRRDFSINAMYYDPQSETVLDYHHGMQDISARTIRMIGEPKQRYREDPVRMLRAIRFAAKTGFKIESATREPIANLARLIEEVPHARLFDELLKLLMSGHAWESVVGLQTYGLSRQILPVLEDIERDPIRLKFVQTALKNTDARVKQGKSISPGFLFSTLLWHEVNERWQDLMSSGTPSIPALHEAIDATLASQPIVTGMQRRHESDMKEIWLMQPRLEKRVGRYPYRLIDSPKFRAGYDFLKLLADNDEQDTELAVWWGRFWEGDESARQQLMNEAKAVPGNKESPPKKRRRRTRSRGAKQSASEQTE